LDLYAVTPEWTLAVFAIAVILLDLFVKEKSLLADLSIAGLLISIVFSVLFMVNTTLGISTTAFDNMLAVDNFALFFKVLFAGIAILVILASRDYVRNFERYQGEYYVLILISTIGMMLMASTTELIAIYISLELASISLYILVGFLKNEKSTEASLKYLLLGAVASAVLLFGMAMVFGFTGKTQLGEISYVLQTLATNNIMAYPALILGIVMMIAGLGFKMAVVPFHMWVPDVYEGSPTTITAYLSVGSKAAGFALVLRIFLSAFGLPDWLSYDWGMIFAVISVVTMIVGNVAAIPQSNIKRMLGYSSIAQAGYLMVGLATMGVARNTDTLGQSGVLLFLVSYALTNLGAFIAIIGITDKLGSDQIPEFAGMGKRTPVLALALTLCLVSLIGMPPAVGFMAKFYIFSGAVQNGLLWLVIIAVINSVISAYYYLRVVKVMWFDKPFSQEKVVSSVMLRTGLAITSLGVLLFGLFPNIIIQIAERAVAKLGFF
jgi:NADH-quinone oxidoreductase subunit N